MGESQNNKCTQLHNAHNLQAITIYLFTIYRDIMGEQKIFREFTETFTYRELFETY